VLACPKITNKLNLVWHRMLYICSYMAAVGVKGLTRHAFEGCLAWQFQLSQAFVNSKC